MMTAEQLKASILQLAMEGKLVEQRPEEGTGEGLFHQIQAEKSKLVKEGKIKKQKPLRAIDEDEKPFDIPESWRWVRFGEIVSFRMGKTPPREDLSFWKRDIPWVSIADMIDGGVVVKTKEGISQGAFEKKFGSLISPKGTLIMSFKLSVGKVSILGENCVHNEAIISIFPFIDFNNSFRDYLFHMLPELSQYGHANKAVKGFTLNNSSISNMLVPLPPLQEQFRIVQKLELLAPFVKQYKSVSEKLDKLNVDFPDQMTKSILQMAVEGKLVEQRPEEGTGEELFRKIQEEKAKLIKEGKIKKQKPLADITDEEKTFDIPESWKWLRLDQIATVVTDGEHKTPRRVSKYCGYYLLSARNVLNGRIQLSDVDYVDEEEFLSISKRCNPVRGDVLISCSGTIGRCTIVDDDNAYVMVRSAAMVRALIVPEYLMYCLQSAFLQEQMRKNAKQTAQANLFQAAIRNYSGSVFKTKIRGLLSES